MGDQSAVWRCSAAGGILDLKQSPVMLYTLLHIREIVAPESIRALKHFPAWTVTVGQSETSPIVNSCGCSPYSLKSSSLLEEGSSSLKHPNPHPSLGKSLTVHFQ